MQEPRPRRPSIGECIARALDIHRGEISLRSIELEMRGAVDHHVARLRDKAEQRQGDIARNHLDARHQPTIIPAHLARAAD